MILLRGLLALLLLLSPVSAFATTTIDAAQVNISGTFNSPTVGPNASQQHVLPAVASDTVTLNAATQTLTGKTLTAPTLGTPTISNPVFSGTSSGTYTLGGTKTITGATTFGTTVTSYNGDTTAANGLASIVGNVAATAQTANIAATTAFTPAATGVYRVAYYVVVTGTGTSTNLVLTVTGTDTAAARTRTASTVSCAATNFTSGEFVMVNTNSAMQYATTMTGTCTFSVYLSVQRLS